MDDLQRLMDAVHKSPKYARVCEDVVRGIGARELAARRSLKEAIKATKNKLHQVGGAYLAGELPYVRWSAELQAAASAGDTERLRSICLQAMQQHASTRERLPILEAFYAQTLAALPPPQVVLDVACGLNPLAILWMGLPPSVQYYACDIYADMVEFIDEFLRVVHVAGEAQVCDVAHIPPTRRADLALLLKTLPCIEQLDKSAGLRLLETVNAEHLLVSFPVRSLGGRGKGMRENCEAHLRELLVGKPWPVQRFEFDTELAFLIHKA